MDSCNIHDPQEEYDVYYSDVVLNTVHCCCLDIHYAYQEMENAPPLPFLLCALHHYDTAADYEAAVDYDVVVASNRNYRPTHP